MYINDGLRPSAFFQMVVVTMLFFVPAAHSVCVVEATDQPPFDFEVDPVGDTHLLNLIKAGTPIVRRKITADQLNYIDLTGSRFRGQSDFWLPNLRELVACDITKVGGPVTPSTPCIFEGRVSFQGMKAESASFVSAEFHDHADFSSTEITEADFTNALFTGDVDFQNARFKRKVVIDGTRFQGSICLPWKSLIRAKAGPWPWQEADLLIEPKTSRTFSEFESVYARSTDLESQNEAFYGGQLAVNPFGFSRWIGTQSPNPRNQQQRYRHQHQKPNLGRFEYPRRIERQ
jgi:uncharacterized protein YjbI with pentapeptide repeats